MAVRGKRPPAKKTATVSRDVSQYADKAPTEFHKCFARWIVEEVGYRPANRKDFLMGVSISTAARNIFQQSEYLANWREETGEAKRGPKPKNEASTNSKGRSKAKPAPEPEPEEAEWTEEDVEEREDELNEMTVAALKKLARTDCEATPADLKELTKKADVIGFILDYEFPEEEEGDDEDEEDDDDYEEDDEDDDDEDEEDDDDDEEEEVEEAPKARGRRSSSARSTGKTTQPRQGKVASGAKAKSGKDDYLF